MQDVSEAVDNNHMDVDVDCDPNDNDSPALLPLSSPSAASVVDCVNPDASIDYRLETYVYLLKQHHGVQQVSDALFCMYTTDAAEGLDSGSKAGGGAFVFLHHVELLSAEKCLVEKYVCHECADNVNCEFFLNSFWRKETSKIPTNRLRAMASCCIHQQALKRFIDGHHPFSLVVKSYRRIL